MVTILADYKDYKISEPAIIISSEKLQSGSSEEKSERVFGFCEACCGSSKRLLPPVQTNPVPANTPNKAVPGAPVVPGGAVPAPNNQQPAAPNKMPQPMNAPQTAAPVVPASMKTQAKPVPTNSGYVLAGIESGAKSTTNMPVPIIRQLCQ